MESDKSLLEWWQSKRIETRKRLQVKRRQEGLSEIKEMILNPYTLDQAHQQVTLLNQIAGTIAPNEGSSANRH